MAAPDTRPELELPDLRPPSRFLSPVELARSDSVALSFVASPFDDSDDEPATGTPDFLGRDSDEDADDEETMEHLLAARRRLDVLAISEQNGGDVPAESLPTIESLEPKKAATYGPTGGKKRSSSSVEPRQIGELQQRRRDANQSNISLPDMDLKLDLTSIPLPSYIDAERRRIRAATERLAASDAWPASKTAAERTPPAVEPHAAPGPSPATSRALRLPDEIASWRSSDSGFRFGLGPYDALERGEWRWSPQDPGSVRTPTSTTPRDAPDAAAHLAAPSLLSNVQAEWTWALSPAPPPAIPSPALAPGDKPLPALPRTSVS